MIISCQQWFSTCQFPDNLNNTIIVLISKVEKLDTHKDLRPVSLCNVIYKVFAKTLTNRL